jgi:hypothetical protein
MLYGKNMTVMQLKELLEELVNDGKGNTPIGLVANNHSCEGDRERITVSECHCNFTKEERKYIVIGNWDPDRPHNLNFKFDSYIYSNPVQ